MVAIRRHETPGPGTGEFVSHSNPSSKSFIMRMRQSDPIAPAPSLTHVLRKGWREGLLYGQFRCYSKIPFPRLSLGRRRRWALGVVLANGLEREVVGLLTKAGDEMIIDTMV